MSATRRRARPRAPESCEPPWEGDRAVAVGWHRTAARTLSQDSERVCAALGGAALAANALAALGLAQPGWEAVSPGHRPALRQAGGAQPSPGGVKSGTPPTALRQAPWAPEGREGESAPSAACGELPLRSGQPAAAALRLPLFLVDLEAVPRHLRDLRDPCKRDATAAQRMSAEDAAAAAAAEAALAAAAVEATAAARAPLQARLAARRAEVAALRLELQARRVSLRKAEMEAHEATEACELRSRIRDSLRARRAAAVHSSAAD